MTYLEMALRVSVRAAEPAPSEPGREPDRPCIRCLEPCAEGELFCSEGCFALWKAERSDRRRRAFRGSSLLGQWRPVADEWIGGSSSG